MGRMKPNFLQVRRQPLKKYVAVTAETRFALHTLPRDTRRLLEGIIPAFDDVRMLPASPQRWLEMLARIPDDVLEQLPQLKTTKPQQAGQVVVMLSVYARALLYPTDETGMRCEMLDTDVHQSSNRIYLYYFPMERFRRLGYVDVDWPTDPFVDWPSIRFRYTEAGIAAGAAMEDFAPAETTVAGQIVETTLEALGLA